VRVLSGLCIDDPQLTDFLEELRASSNVHRATDFEAFPPVILLAENSPGSRDPP
jgi:hypothetical protein